MALCQGKATAIGMSLSSRGFVGSLSSRCWTITARAISCSAVTQFTSTQVQRQHSPMQQSQPPRRPRRRVFIKLGALGLQKAKLVHGKSHLNEDWTDVWPVSRHYDHNVVHLPIRMGQPLVSGDPIPDSISNQELLKIPNFLHLTPRHIEKHVAALRPLCTKWPTDMSNDTHPVRVTTSNCLRASSSSLHPTSHVVTMSVHIDAVPLFKEKFEKLTAIVGDRYDPKERIITLKSDTLPSRKLNRDHLRYQLLAIYFELRKEEDWEKTPQIPIFNV